MPSLHPTDADGYDEELEELERRRGRCMLVARGAAWFAIALGAVVLLAWGADWSWLKSLLPGAATMKPITASCFVLTGVALLLRLPTGSAPSGEPAGDAARVGRSRVAVGCAALAVFLGVLTSVEYLFGFQFPIERWLFRGALINGEHPGRMSGATALGFIALGSGLLALDRVTKRERWPAQHLLGATVALGLLALVAYVYGLRELYSFPGYASMAPHTSGLFVLTGVGALLARPERGWMGVATSSAAGGIVARRILPIALLLPMLIGALCIAGARQGIYQEPLGPALFCVAVMLAFHVAVWGAARSLNRIDSARLLAARTAQRNAENLRVTLQSIGDGVIVTDAASDVTMMNRVAEALTGWTADDASGRSVEEVLRVLDEETRSAQDRAMARVEKATPFRGFVNGILLLARDGRELPIAETGAKIRNARGEVTGAVFVFRDQTEERRWTRALSESEAIKTSILDSSLDCIVTADEEGRIVDFNPAAEKVFGFRAQDVVGRELAETIVRPDDRARYRAQLASQRTTGAATRIGRRMEGVAVRADRTEFPVEMALVSFEAKGRMMFTAFLRDITERKRIEVAMRVSLAEKETLLKEVHHRVKNNMQVISSILGLQAAQEDDEGARNAIEECRARVYSMVLVHERLYRRGTLSTIDFESYLRELASEVQSSMVGSERVRLVIEAQPLPVELDRAIPLGLIVNELIANAFKYALENETRGTVTVRLLRDGTTRVLLSVSDDGIGWPEGASWDSADSMGIKMVRILVEQLDGQIELPTRGGASVVVRFPCTPHRTTAL